MKSLLTLSSVLLVVVVLTGQVHAQSANADLIRQLIPEQISESLQSSHAQVRSQTLKNVICYSTLHRNRVYLGSVVSAIAEVAEGDASASNRRLAVAALRAIDSYQSRSYLTKLGGMEDDEYSTLVAGVLTEYEAAKRAASQM